MAQKTSGGKHIFVAESVNDYYKIPNDTYFTDLSLGLDMYKDSSGNIVNPFSDAQGYAPLMTTAQRLAISSPSRGYVVYDTDLNDLMQYDKSATVSEWVSFGAKGVLVQQDTISDLFVPAGYTYITFGAEPGLGGVSGPGTYVNITGSTDEVLRFNSTGFPVTSPVKIHLDGTIKTPAINSTPAGSVNGDWWFQDIGGVTYLVRKNSLGVIQKIQLI